MAYVLFNNQTGKFVKAYATQHGARIGMAAANRKAGWEVVSKIYTSNRQESVHGRCTAALPASYGTAPFSIRPELAYWNGPGAATRTVKNLMTGEMVQENVNTPYCCSVASESYWSN